MNLNDIKDSLDTGTREIEFKPVGEPTGMFFELRYESEPEVQEFMKRYNAKLRDLSLKRKTNAITNLVRDHEDGLRIVHVAGWRWADGVDEEAGRPEFSRKELRALLDDEKAGFHVRRFIDEEVGSLDDFLSKSQDN